MYAWECSKWDLVSFCRHQDFHIQKHFWLKSFQMLSEGDHGLLSSKLPRISSNWTSQNLKQNKMISFPDYFLVQHLVQLLVVVSSVSLPSLGCNLCCWSRSHEGKFKIIPIDPAIQYVENFASVKNVVIDRIILLWHTGLQKSRFTACPNNVDSALTNSSWTCCLRQCKPSTKSFCL